MRLINKLKKLVGISVSEYTIFYTNELTASQVTTIANRMINHFSFSCKPNRISVSRQTATIDFQNACITGEQLKKVSDDTLAPDKVEISRITLDGSEIWHK